MPIAWVDCISPSEALFFGSLLKEPIGVNTIFTSLDTEEVEWILDAEEIEHRSIGMQDALVNRGRLARTILRLARLCLEIERFHLSISFGNPYALVVSRFRLRPSIIFLDNDIPNFDHDFAFGWASFVFCPSTIDPERLERRHICQERVVQFDGLKEEVYLSDFTPDPSFCDSLPFRDYVVVRPEALHASYVRNKVSIAEALVEEFVESHLNVIYLARSRRDPILKLQKKNLCVPNSPLKGPDLCWNAKAVVTGSGTIAREAALLGVPAISFFPDQLLSVDRWLVGAGMMEHSRNVGEICELALRAKGRDATKVDFHRFRQVKLIVARLLAHAAHSALKNRT